MVFVPFVTYEWVEVVETTDRTPVNPIPGGSVRLWGPGTANQLQSLVFSYRLDRLDMMRGDVNGLLLCNARPFC